MSSTETQSVYRRETVYDMEICYDVNGNMIKQTLSDGTFYLWTYDKNNNMLSQKLPGGAEETWTYDSNNNVTTHHDYFGNHRVIKQN